MPLPPGPPTIIPGYGSSFTVGNCISNLSTKFGNRQDISVAQGGLADGSKAATAVIEALKELTETYEFEELKYQTPVPPATTLNLTAGNPIVPIGLLLGTIAGNTVYPQFQNQNWTDLTDVYTFWIWFSGGVTQAGRTLKYRRITTIDMYSYGITSNNQNQLGVAPPVYQSRFGSIIQVGPVPDISYQFFVRMKLRHPFPIAGTQVFTPATFTVTLTAGAVTAVTVVSGGSGYLPSLGNIPMTFTQSPNGSVATATANSNSTGIITGVNLGTGGSGYAVAPSAATAAVSAQLVFMPDSWQEIVELCACQRIALWEGASEYIGLFEGMLSTKGIDIPAARAKRAQMVRDEMHNERQMSLMVNPYTFA